MNARSHSGIEQDSALIPRTRRSTTDLLRAASGDPARPLDTQVRRPLEQRLNYDLGHIRIHSGRASDAAADRLGARAYALGRDIHLGAESRALTAERRERLLAHEAVHTVQQGGASVSPHDGLCVSRPSDPAELEAARIADTPTSGGTGITAVSPQVQRDLTDPRKSLDGQFDLNLKTESHPNAKSGMSGTIKFRAYDTAPDAAKIRLLQIARVEDLDTGKEHEWKGDEANRMKVMTKVDAKNEVDPGFFVDVVHKNRAPRTAKTDAPVLPYYIDDYPAAANPDNKDGSKRGKTITEASLRDWPGTTIRSRFSFETAAKAPDTGYVYAALRWGFTLSDPAKGLVENEHATARALASPTMGAAVSAFDDFYQNPGTAKAPK
ncbi:DUF4157 domain-containing protein [Bradyrhizobium liaoningense]|uniref:eCIS core domain-containing protein n=1 Tax=Bradyrhizobium liaoningense TaxID=43992 RepID=UPI001BA46178|nr:DUF4157 domain-containing protein [Bradyrhizobium liaoningense]MBR0713547.1 DUF4157 domain-containing protein [Bradyrhizobium liaoningense]